MTIDHKFENTTLVKKGNLEFIQFDRVSKWDKRHSPRCTICNHKDVGIIENLYLDWCTLASLRREYGLQKDPTCLRNHFVVTGLEQRRLKVRRSVYNNIIQRGMESGTVPALTQVLHAVEQLDKLDGEIIERKKSTGRVEEKAD